MTNAPIPAGLPGFRPSERTAGQGSTRYHLTCLPDGSALHSVTAAPADVAGRRALRVEFSDAVTLQGTPNVDYIDMPTFVALPGTFEDGTIEVDSLSRLNGKGPADARAFAGIAYRIAEDASRFESVYVRPLNGLTTGPPRPGTSGQFSTSPTPTGGTNDSGNATRTAATKPALTLAPASGSG